MNVLKTSFVLYGYFEDIFCTLWMFQRSLLYFIDVSKTSFVRYKCLEDSFLYVLKTPAKLPLNIHIVLYRLRVASDYPFFSLLIMSEYLKRSSLFVCLWLLVYI